MRVGGYGCWYMHVSYCIMVHCDDMFTLRKKIIINTNFNVQHQNNKGRLLTLAASLLMVADGPVFIGGSTESARDDSAPTRDSSEPKLARK